MSAAASVLEFHNVCCARGGAEVRDVSLALTGGSSIVLVAGPGCDVDLLLRLASLEERPDSGHAWLDGEPAHALSDESRATLRSHKVGMVFSAPHLLPGLSAVENVAVPLFKLLHLDTAEAAERTHAILEFAGFRGDPSNDVSTLSRADQQRVALARALVHRPVLLALHHAEDGLAPGDAIGFRETIARACAEFGMLALATAPATPGVMPGEKRLLIAAGGAVSIEP